MRHHHIVLSLFVAALGGSACKQDAVTLVDTTVRGAGGAPVGIIPAFTPVKVRAVPFVDDGWIRVVEGPVTGEAREALVGVLPLKATTLWIGAVQADLRLKEGTRRLTGCSTVAGIPVKTDDGEFFIVVEQGGPVGIMGRKDTTATKPAADAFWPAAQAALRELRADDATAAAEATLTCDPAHAGAREVLAALVGRDDPGRATELLARRKAAPPPLPPVASGADLRNGAVAFITTTDESLRSEPAADAPVVVALPIGTSVRVLDAGGPFARVQSLVGDLVVELPDPFAGAALDDGSDDVDDGEAAAPPASGGDAPPPPPAPKPDDAGRPDPFASAVRDVLRVGFVPAGALANSAPDVDRLDAEATSLGVSAEAVVLRQRALALEPGRDALRKALVDVALKAGRPREAALALHTPARHASGSRVLADMTTLRGCLGDVRRATVVDGEDVPLDELRGDICVDFDPRPACLDRQCPDDYVDGDCDCGEGDHDHEDGEGDAGPPKPDAVVEAEAAAARAREEAEALEAAAAAAREQAEDAEARIELVTAIEAKKERSGKLDALLPRGPFVRLSLRRLASLPPGTTLHLARMQITQDCNENGEQLEDIQATFAPQPLPLPTPRPQGDFTVLFEAKPGFTYAVYRVAAGEPGPDSDELADRREARLAEVYVPDSEPDCSCTPFCWR